MIVNVYLHIRPRQVVSRFLVLAFPYSASGRADLFIMSLFIINCLRLVPVSSTPDSSTLDWSTIVNYWVTPTVRSLCGHYSEFQLRWNMACSVKALPSPLCRSVGNGNCSSDVRLFFTIRINCEEQTDLSFLSPKT